MRHKTGDLVLKKSKGILLVRLTDLRNPEIREIYFSLLRKRALQFVRRPQRCKPVFIFGRQRSGTTMLMRALHRHPETLVYDERADSPAFSQFRLRDFEIINGLLSQSRFPIACFKPICDSHMIREFDDAFPAAHHLWLYRDYQDVANSSLRKFDKATDAIKKVCTGRSGGGYFQEGVSAEVARVLQDVYSPDLTEFDLACLIWWARNFIIFESNLHQAPNVTFVKYEALVTDPYTMFPWLFERMNVPLHPNVMGHISAGSIRRHSAPVMNETVRHLCDTLLLDLNKVFNAYSPLSQSRLNSGV